MGEGRESERGTERGTERGKAGRGSRVRVCRSLRWGRAESSEVRVRLQRGWRQSKWLGEESLQLGVEAARGES